MRRFPVDDAGDLVIVEKDVRRVKIAVGQDFHLLPGLICRKPFKEAGLVL